MDRVYLHALKKRRPQERSPGIAQTGVSPFFRLDKTFEEGALPASAGLSFLSIWSEISRGGAERCPLAFSRFGAFGNFANIRRGDASVYTLPADLVRLESRFQYLIFFFPGNVGK